jgi:hypothetical protein
MKDPNGQKRRGDPGRCRGFEAQGLSGDEKHLPQFLDFQKEKIKGSEALVLRLSTLCFAVKISNFPSRILNPQIQITCSLFPTTPGDRPSNL